MKVQAVVWCLATSLVAAAATDSPQVTFTRDVAPILQKNCQGCHRPGEAAPMSLLTYQQARPWAKAIREAVLLKRMPPWYADPHYGKFANDRSLSQAEIDTLVAWADTGAKEGDPKDLPPPRQFVEGWNIGQPDVVFEMAHEFQIPASGTIEYQYIVIPTGFTEDRWVQHAEVRPGNRAVVHHVIAFIREPGSKWMRDAQPGIPFVPKRRSQDPQRGLRSDDPQQGRRNNDDEGGGQLLVGFAPGLQPETLPDGEAKLVKAGSDVVFQMHYTASGKAGVDRTRIGLVFAKQPPQKRVMTVPAANRKFVIPPGAPSHRVDSEITFQDKTTLIALMPHMHLRGKDFEYRLVYPTGESQILLRVPRYSFNWQLFYYLEKPLAVTKGTRLECTAHFDNSPNNPDNPNPNEEVRWGDQSWEEMMIGWFTVAMDPAQKPADLFKEKKPQPQPTRSSD